MHFDFAHFFDTRNVMLKLIAVFLVLLSLNILILLFNGKRRKRCLSEESRANFCFSILMNDSFALVEVEVERWSTQSF